MSACSTGPILLPETVEPAAETEPATDDYGHLWIQNAAEYQALSLQVYQAATDALAGFLADSSWSALPNQADAANLPPAVILDVDETVVSNIEFQMNYERPFTNMKLYLFNKSHRAIPVAGVVDFVNHARNKGVTVFFVTNRPCELVDGDPDPCPLKRSTIDDLAEIGIETDEDHVFLSDEQGWNREKSVRRQYLAETHRILMLFGDDLGDFLTCVRKKLYAPCTDAATPASRRQMVLDHQRFWGRGWYVLPNPMHGSWTSSDTPLGSE